MLICCYIMNERARTPVKSQHFLKGTTKIAPATSGSMLLTRQRFYLKTQFKMHERLLKRPLILLSNLKNVLMSFLTITYQGKNNNTKKYNLYLSIFKSTQRNNLGFYKVQIYQRVTFVNVTCCSNWRKIKSLSNQNLFD